MKYPHQGRGGAVLAGASQAGVDALRQRVREAYRADETVCLRQRLADARLGPEREQAVRRRARQITAAARRRSAEQIGIEALLREYDLSSQEGVLLMCIAEALLRIPDAATADRLVRDRLAKGHWDEHLGSGASLLVNASTWGLLLTGRLLHQGASGAAPEQSLKQLVSRLGEPVVRVAMQGAMRILAQQFVAGRDIGEALRRVRGPADAVRYSYDCLGEAARTALDVERYAEAYASAITCIGERVERDRDVFAQPGISVKLSALHPRYEFAQRDRVLGELLPRLRPLVEQAAAAGIGLTLDAEEADRLDLSLDIFEALLAGLRDPTWQGLGLAVQSYQKRAWPLLEWLAALARLHRRRIPVRLVKGAYWDSEIKWTQERGLNDYPVFTRKAATDVSFLACADLLMRNPDCFYPQIATHNAMTLAWVHELGQGRDYELQRLHGMGECLYAVLGELVEVPPVRVYAPVGSHDELLPYLVRRLLENGANTSFINQLNDDELDLDRLVDNPCERVAALDCQRHPHIPLPRDLYGTERRNSRGWDLTDPVVVERLGTQLEQACAQPWRSAARVAGEDREGEIRELVSPANREHRIGQVAEAGDALVERALAVAADAASAWDQLGGARRAEHLLRAADLFEQHGPRLMARVIREGGRTIPDAVSELREAVDYCRYYARQAQQEFERPRLLPGPTGERNELWLRGRGVFVCISPWNFPLAIFVGQIVGALAAGNTVIAKPARQTPLTGYEAVALLHRAGVPGEVLQFLPGSGSRIGERLFASPRLAGVAMTGSTETARRIQQALATRRGPIVPLIAETGGQNIMIADSSALPEQLVVDVLESAFNSAGQRCSALRALFVQEEIADRFIGLLIGAMDELRIGDPLSLSTDVGPLIDPAAVHGLEPHVERMKRQGRLLHRLYVDAQLSRGSFFAPRVYEIDGLGPLDREVFGPILHLIRYRGDRLDAVIDAVNGTGYGLTLGVHSRIEETWQRVRARARVGNIYVNRNMIGAVVGSQPFGGEGLSGTGPKAGGPYYLYRFATERTSSVNTAAVGGNAGLLSLPDS
ncbi:MAG: bifunctional proline dehydrogenase/L-glutamate gamma-semialdehyde dehydrogenase PutA [Gammaproteobacteria bacterium]|jgi:RHH-type proline utilization regulon transcriptional repressor/proline dehydrogenase/delta 1-pyrroline-5-carboxylate dehydrogenase